VTGTARLVSQLGHKALGVNAEPSDQFWSIAKTMAASARTKTSGYLSADLSISRCSPMLALGE